MPNVGDIIRAADFSGAGIKAGAVVPFYNVTLSGRYPIFWGESEADTGWLVCDGGSDLHGGNVPNLSNRFIMGVTSVSSAKKTGGSTTTSSTSTSGTVGATTITSANAGSHQHYIFTDSTVSASIGKNITANTFAVWYYKNTGAYGAYMAVYDSNNSSKTPTLGRTSTGISGSGSHTHSFTGSSHTHTLTPPYYSLIYLVKLP